MPLAPFEQLQEKIKEAGKILILLPQNPSGDALGGAAALRLFLGKIGKTCEVVHNGIVDWEKFKFIKKENIKNSVSGARDFVLSFNTSSNKIMGVRTEEAQGELRIYITPDRGAIDPRDFSFIPAKFKYDLVFVLGACDLEQLGKIYEDNADLFFEVPVVNVDNKSENENFGKINLVDMTASSVSEVVFSFLEKISALDKVDEDIANALLTGIIDATNSFQKKNTTPRSFLISAQLMGYGANQQEIVRWMYKTQSLSILKLWGRVMARLNWDEKIKLAWSLISIEDFVQSRSKIADLSKILDKIKDNYEAGELFMVLYGETADETAGMMKFKDKNLLEKFRQFLNSEVVGDTLKFKVNGGNIIEAEKQILEKINKICSEKE